MNEDTHVDKDLSGEATPADGERAMEAEVAPLALPVAAGAHCDPDSEKAPLPAQGDPVAELHRELTALRESIAARDAFWSRVDGDLAEFRELFPTSSLADLPDSVWEEVGRGASLAAAFALAERRRARTEELAAASNQSNRKKSVGALPTRESDEFTHAEVSAMTPTEVRKNFGAIMRSLPKWRKS